MLRLTGTKLSAGLNKPLREIDMLPTTLPSTTHTQGDLWHDGYRHFGPMTLEDGSPPGPPCLFCQMIFKDDKLGEVVYELNSSPADDQGSITIISGDNYEFDIPNQALPLAIGSFTWVFKTYLSADHSDPPISWFNGQVFVK